MCSDYVQYLASHPQPSFFSFPALNLCYLVHIMVERLLIVEFISIFSLVSYYVEFSEWPILLCWNALWFFQKHFSFLLHKLWIIGSIRIIKISRTLLIFLYKLRYFVKNMVDRYLCALPLFKGLQFILF